MKRYPYLTDKEFLREFDLTKTKEQFVRLTVLDWQERPIKEIQGIAKEGGSINLDGRSPLRRTSNISIIADAISNDLTNVNSLISINKKVFLEVGFKNNLENYKEYDMLWFPQGVFVITSPQIQHSLSGVEISLQLRDKMALLNGEVGGALSSSVVFHEYEYIDSKGKMVIGQPTIYRILIELMNHFGGEPLEKILISDIDQRIKSVIRWNGSSPFFIKRVVAPNGDVQFLYTVDEKVGSTEGYEKYSQGEEIGYTYEDFTFPGELIAQPGETVASVLEKIRNALGNFEFFYDVYGNFIFREIKNYLNTTQAKVELDRLKSKDYFVDMGKGKEEYSLDGSLLVSSYSCSPQFEEIKNDFVVWGRQKGADKVDRPIRYHLAIDRKPKVGNEYKGFFFENPEDKMVSFIIPAEYPSKNDFPSTGEAEIFYFAIDDSEVYQWIPEKGEYNLTKYKTELLRTNDWRSELYLSGQQARVLATDKNAYHQELAVDWTEQFDLKEGRFKAAVKASPLELKYFLDFIDVDGAVGDLSVENIGRRTVVVNDNNINCIFEPEIPDLIFLNTKDPKELAKKRQECEDRGQRYLQVEDGIFKLIGRGGRFNSAYNAVRNLLYVHTSYNESVTIECFPLYHIEPNTLIYLNDPISGIKGRYLIDSISLPLSVNGSMTMSCIKALERD